MSPRPSCRCSLAVVSAFLVAMFIVSLGSFVASPALAQTQPPAPQSGGIGIPAARAVVDTAQAKLEVMLEGALATPEGDLSASFNHTARGFSAGPGYSLGLRVRWFVTPRLAVSPSFHFTEFGEHEDYDENDQRFHVATAAARYGVDLIYQARGAFGDWRPFLGAGVELTQNRFHETFDATATEYKANALALGPRVQAGVRHGDFSAALALQWSRFSTPRFFFTGDESRYVWDTVQVVLGYTLPRI
jgi:hypothetical protein